MTTLFRDPDAWDSLRAHVIAPLVARTSRDRAIRVWVPACATGEEAYTLAMLFCEEFGRHEGRRQLNIFATDLDEGALTVAREGLYGQAINTDLPDERLDRFFRRDGDHYRVIAEVRDLVMFAAHDVLHDPPFSRLHLISCRHVLSHLDGGRQSQLMGMFRYACGDDGYLLIGPDERADVDLFESVDAQHQIYRARAGGQVPVPSLPEPLLDARFHQRRGEVHQLLARLAVVQEEERRRVARDVHDQLGQPMTALRMQIEALELRAGADPALAAAVERTMQLAEDLDRSIDFLTWELRSASVERLELSASLSDLVRSWSERFDLPADYHAEGGHDHALSADASVQVYRIVQEALHNVRKHAQATRVTVLFTHNGQEAAIAVEDDGRGFSPDRLETGLAGHFGLVGMRERARLIGGSLTIESAPGQGTSIVVRVPHSAGM